MRFPTKKRLKAAFPSLTDEKIALMRKLAHAVDASYALGELIREQCPQTEAYRRQCYNDPLATRMWRRTLVLHALDTIMETYGVESLGEGEHPTYAPPYEYLNAGDTYATTLVYHRDADAVRISCWGDLVETGKVA